jgi:hypothetical protein
MAKRLLPLLALAVGSMNAFAQATIDTPNKTIPAAIDLYYQSLGDQSPLYNGREYLEYAYTLQSGDPFFGTAGFINGSINYYGMEFRNVPIIYDIIKDQVIVQHFDKVHKINLQPEQIAWCTLSGHTFVRITPDSSHHLAAGFYDRFYYGKIILLAKREKKIREDHSNFQINNVVDEKTYYYLKKDGLYYNLKNMHSLLNILKTKKKEIQQYLSSNKIKFKADPEQAMIMAAEYYDR